jgi:cytidylate kinase
VVFPRADIKFFLQASPEVRGQRRFLELQSQGAEVGLARTIADVKARDNADTNRSTAPLKQADDAVVIDTTELDIPQVLAHMLAVIHEIRKSARTGQPG